jgi:DNA-binding transcriptional MocR family regulator
MDLRESIQEHAAKLSPRAKLVGYTLAMYVNAETRTAWPAQSTLARECGISVQTVRKSVNELEVAGILTLDRGRGRTTTIYYVPATESQTVSTRQVRPIPSDTPDLSPQAEDPEVAVLLLDFVLGYSAAEDPVGDLVEEIREAKAMVGRRGGRLSVVASVCGTDGDLQDLGYQCKTLEEAGVVLMPSSAQAAEFSLALTSSRGE